MAEHPETTRAPVPCNDVTTLLAYEAGRHDAFHEAADLLKLSPSTIRLHAGEMTAQEMRTVQAVLTWLSGSIRDKAHD